MSAPARFVPGIFGKRPEKVRNTPPKYVFYMNLLKYEFVVKCTQSPGGMGIYFGKLSSCIDFLNLV